MEETESTQTEFEDVTVTAIIPYCEEYTPRAMLSEAIESVESQVGVDTEVVVVEDEEQRGPAWARNVGLERSDTRYVGFLDADDQWKERKAIEQLRRMEETGSGVCIDGKKDYSPVEFAGALLTGETFGLTSSIMVDTTQVSARFDESLERREDHLYMIEAAAEGGVCFLPETFIDGSHEEGLSNYVDTSPQQIDEFFELVVDVLPAAERYRRTYYQRSYVYLGRLRHEDGEYRAALRYFVRSLEHGPNVLAIGAMGLTLLAFLYDYPLRPVRQVLGGRAHE